MTVSWVALVSLSGAMTSELITLPLNGTPADEKLTEVDEPLPLLLVGAALVPPPMTEVPTNPCAISIAFCASPAEATVPIRMIVSETVLTLMSPVGMATRRRS